MQHRNMPSRVGWIIRIVCPSIRFRCLGMAYQFEHFDNSIPYRLALKYLLNGNTLLVPCVHSVKAFDRRT